MSTLRKLGVGFALVLAIGTLRLFAADMVFPPVSADKPDTEWWKELQAMEHDEIGQRFNQRVDQLIARSKAEDDAILLDHFQSIKAMVQLERALMLPPEEGMPSWNREHWVSTFARRFVFTFTIPGDSDDAQALAFTRKQGHFFHSFTSRYDGKMAYCWIYVPSGYWEKRHDKSLKYPLIVDLHGSCGVHGPMWASWFMGYQPPYRDIQGADDFWKKKGALGQMDCFYLMPWMGYYRPMADAELWQELDWVRYAFPIDPDRRYLTGASLGGAATWHFATRTPGYWAAIVPVVGTWGEEWFFPWLQENIKDIPILMRNGERDPNVRHPYPEYKALKAIHANVQLILNPEAGHPSTDIEMEAMHQWMLNHKREQPRQFSFTADSPWYPGRTGIEMCWNPTNSARPKFTCRIEGQEVHIDSEGTPGLLVNLGPDGLGLTGEVSVFWNGKLAEKKKVAAENAKVLDPIKNCWAGSIYVKKAGDSVPVWPIDEHSHPASAFIEGQSPNLVKLGAGGGGTVWAWSLMRHERQ